MSHVLFFERASWSESLLYMVAFYSITYWSIRLRSSDSLVLYMGTYYIGLCRVVETIQVFFGFTA
ncbi:hypothetical protein PALB_3900 [Pseudoalteromonas luteoviolacea B = ATCC 29581]|nr:hypothetical protein PALB_3900 [Pseudoalteromonas luteoviolacea B = ATCC 29581]